MVNSINSNIAAYFAQANISAASNNSAASVARLSSGNRIVKSSDDVAALSIGTSLQTGVSTLKVALTNASQGTSLLQVADGALAQINTILQQQKAIALQAASGSLTNVDRGFLDQQFQALSSEIDSIASSTTFNGVQLINGSLSTGTIAKAAATQSSKGVGTISIVDNQHLANGSHFVINGITLNAATTPSDALDFQIGATASQSLASLADKLNTLATSGTAAQQKALGGATYSVDGSTLTVTARSGGALDATFKIDVSAANTTSGSKVVSAGGQFGGAKVNLFATGFSSTTSSVTQATTATAENPFVVGDNITFSTGTGSTQTLYTLTADDSLTDITNGINARTSITGVSANLVTTAAGVYNIQLAYDNSSSDHVSINGGAKYFNSSTSSSSATTSNVTHAINTGTTSFQLFAADFTAGATVVSNTQSATAVLKDTDHLFVAIDSPSTSNTYGGTTYVDLGVLTGKTTLASVVDGINSSTAAKAAGISATLSDSGGNIKLITNDSSGTRVLNVVAATSISSTGVIAGTGVYNVDDTGANATNGLNTGYTTHNIFDQYITGTSASTVIGGSPDGTTTGGFFKTGNAVSVTIPGLNNGSAITLVASLSATGADATVAGLAKQINASANAALYGIHAKVVTSGGTVNIQLSVADGFNKGAALSSISLSPGANYVPGTAGVLSATGSNSYVAQAGTSFADASNVSRNTTYALSGGIDNGLGQGNTSVIGTIGDNVLATLSQDKASTTLTFPTISDSHLTDSGNFASDGSVNLQVGDQKFYFVTNATLPDQIQIGSNLKETLDNAISTITKFAADNATGDVAYQLNQVNVTRDVNSLVFSGKNLSNVYKLDGSTAVQVSLNGGFQGSSVTNSGNLNNASNGTTPGYGVDATGVSNAAFAGTISGFTASYSSANTVSLSIKVGNYTYTASGVSTNPTANTDVRFLSNTLDDGTNGGYFDVQLQANDGSSVTDQASATTYAERLDAAFSSLSFLQERTVSSYHGTGSIVVNNTQVGSLIGSKVSAQLPSFDSLKLSDVKILAPSGSSLDASVSVTINGVVYKTAAGLGSQLGANQTIRLTSQADSNHFIDFTTGNTAIDLSSTANAKAAQDALGNAFGINDGSAALTFQIGASSSDSLAVTLGSAKTDTLFNGAKLDVLTADDANAASSALDSALSTISSLRATVGALESQFNFASANIQTSVQNQDAARGALLDTDIATESTNYATSQVKLQAGISVLAQANQQLQALLKLIG